MARLSDPDSWVGGALSDSTGDFADAVIEEFRMMLLANTYQLSPATIERKRKQGVSKPDLAWYEYGDLFDHGITAITAKANASGSVSTGFEISSDRHRRSKTPYYAIVNILEKGGENTAPMPIIRHLRRRIRDGSLRAVRKLRDDVAKKAQDELK